MKSHTLPSFWDAYQDLNNGNRHRAQKAYQLWSDNPFHPSLHFKCINTTENIWSVRISRGCRALCIWEDKQVYWFWIGNHDAYEKFCS